MLPKVQAGLNPLKYVHPVEIIHDSLISDSSAQLRANTRCYNVANYLILCILRATNIMTYIHFKSLHNNNNIQFTIL